MKTAAILALALMTTILGPAGAILGDPCGEDSPAVGMVEVGVGDTRFYVDSNGRHVDVWEESNGLEGLQADPQHSWILPEDTPVCGEPLTVPPDTLVAHARA